jgi:glycosyltransferase involved in cell wall biosynthesis
MPQEITIVSGIYPPDVGGPATFSEAFAEYLCSKSIKVNIVSTHESKNISYQPSDFLQIKLFSRNSKIFFRTLNIAFEIGKKFRSSQMVIANGAFLETYLGTLFALGKAKYVTKIPGDIVWERACSSGYTNVDVFTFQSTKLNAKYKLLRFLFSRSLKRSEAVIVPAPYLRNLCLSWGINESKIIDLGNTVDTDRFQPNSKIEKIYDVITVSRLVPVKQIDMLIKVCANLNLSLAIVGDGPLLKDLQSLSSKLKARVSFLGLQNQTQLPLIYQQSKVFVLNSQIEATSYALLEARSSGLVSIANSGTGSEQVIRHLVDGILCGSPTGFELEGALKYVLGQEFDMKKAGDLARSSTLNEYDRKSIFGRIYKLLEYSWTTR